MHGRQTTVEEKKARGTHRPCRDSRRSLAEIQADITDALEALDMMRTNLHLVVDAIKELGMYVDTVRTDNQGGTRTDKKLNPAFRVQREALAGMRAFSLALVLLREEEQLALKRDKKPEADEFEGLI